MKHFITTLFLLAFVLVKTSNAQTPEWLWAETQTGGSCYTQAEQIGVSQTGSVYISGRYAVE